MSEENATMTAESIRSKESKKALMESQASAGIWYESRAEEWPEGVEWSIANVFGKDKWCQFCQVDSVDSIDTFLSLLEQQRDLNEEPGRKPDTTVDKVADKHWTLLTTEQQLLRLATAEYNRLHEQTARRDMLAGSSKAATARAKEAMSFLASNQAVVEILKQQAALGGDAGEAARKTLESFGITL